MEKVATNEYGNDIVYTATSLPMGVKNREFLNMEAERVSADGTQIEQISRACTHPDFPIAGSCCTLFGRFILQLHFVWLANNITTPKLLLIDDAVGRVFKGYWS